MSTKELQIAERARKYKHEALTNLQQFIDMSSLEICFLDLNRKSSPGVDGKTWQEYAKEKPARLPELLTLMKSGKYQAPSIRRVYIPKGKTGRRPLGIPTIEDKILQEAVRRTLDPIYEEDFYDFSYGFRKGRSAHDAVEYMFQQVSFNKLHYIIDADIKSYFDTIDHSFMREFLDKRVKDKVIRKMIDKWLKAGILEGSELRFPTEGTPQGGIISPLLSNIYLHYVLDEWFAEVVKPRMKGKCFMVRYADDFVIGFEYLSDANRVMKVLPKRFGKYNLELHPEKTRIVNLNTKYGDGDRSFDFLGFTHYLGLSRKGYKILKSKTSKKKLTAALTKFESFLKANRHQPLPKLIRALNVRLRGHYNYYGITFNSKGIANFYEQCKRKLQKWLNRRGGKPKWNWELITHLTEEWLPLLKPRIYHSYLKRS